MLEKMQELIADQLSVDADSITEASSFKDDLGADSLDLYELIMALEEEYDVEIPTDDLESINTVGDVINFLKSKGVTIAHNLINRSRLTPRRFDIVRFSWCQCFRVQCIRTNDERMMKERLG